MPLHVCILYPVGVGRFFGCKLYTYSQIDVSEAMFLLVIFIYFSLILFLQDHAVPTTPTAKNAPVAVGSDMEPSTRWVITV